MNNEVHPEHLRRAFSSFFLPFPFPFSIDLKLCHTLEPFSRSLPINLRQPRVVRAVELLCKLSAVIDADGDAVGLEGMGQSP